MLKVSNTVADRVAEYLVETAGIDRVFIYPGGTIAPLVNAFVKLDIKIEVFKHEQGAAYAALAFARLTGRAQVVMVTSGPGVTNVLTPLADAYYDSTPTLFIMGQVGTGDLCSGRNVRQRGFQETPTVELTRPISKLVGCPVTTDEALSIVPVLWAAMLDGREGPAVLDFPMDIQRAESVEPISSINVCGQKSNSLLSFADHKALDEIVLALKDAKRPILLLGHGVLGVKSNLIEALASRIDALVVSSLLGLGSYATWDEKFLGYIGHTGHLAANNAIHSSDFVLALGTRLDVRQTGTMTKSFVPQGRLAWVNNDPSEINNPRVDVDWALQADSGEVIDLLLKKISQNQDGRDVSWQKACRKERLANQEDEQALGKSENISPKQALKFLASYMKEMTPGVVTTGVGSHQQWAARHLPFAPNGWRLLTSAGHGAMGYDLPSAIGASIARPGDLVICIVGDGSLLMNIQELASLSERSLPVKIILLNNRRLGIVSQFQLITWGDDPGSGHFQAPDFVAIAKGFGIHAERVNCLSQLESNMKEFLLRQGPGLIEIPIDHNANVVPMLLGGQEMNDMWMGKLDD